MKSKALCTLFSIMIGCALLAMIALPCSAKTIQWQMVDFGVAGTKFFKVSGPPFAEMVKKMSNGRLDIKVYPVGVIVPSTEIFNSVASGAIQIACECPPYHRGAVRIAELEWGYPAAWRNHDDFKLFRDHYGFIEIVREAYARHNVHLLELTSGGGLSLISKKPVRSLADFKGMKIRAIGGMAEVMKKAGASTTWIPGPELYTSLSTGVVDGVVYGSITDCNDLKLQEVAKYWISPNLHESQGAVQYIVNLKAFNALPDDLKSILETAAKAMRGAYYYDVQYRSARILKEWKEKFGVQVTSFSQQDMNQLREYSEKLMDKLAEEDKEYSASGVKILKNMWKDLGIQ